MITRSSHPITWICMLFVLIMFADTSCISKRHDTDMYITNLRANLDRADAMGSEQANEALVLYKQVACTIADSAMQAVIAPIVYDALDGIAANIGDSGDQTLEWLIQLSKHPTELIHQCGMRDLNSTIASAFYQKGDMSSAAKHLTLALEDTLYYPTPERYFRDNVRGAQIFMPVDETPERVIACLEAAEMYGKECASTPKEISFVRSF